MLAITNETPRTIFGQDATLEEMIANWQNIHQVRFTLAYTQRCVNIFSTYLSDALLENWHTIPEHLRERVSHFAPATQRHILGTCRRFLRFAVIFHGVDPRAPEMILLPPEPMPNPDVLTHDQCRALLRACANRMDYLTYSILCLYHGLRAGEAIAVEAQDVDLDANMIYLRWRPTRRLKTHTSVRRIPIPTVAQPFLEMAKSRRPEGRILPFSRFWAGDERKRIGISATATLMRHTYVSALGSGRVQDAAGNTITVYPHPDLGQVSRLVGHKSARTLDYYLGASDGIPGLDPREFCRVDELRKADPI